MTAAIALSLGAAACGSDDDSATDTTPVQATIVVTAPPATATDGSDAAGAVEISVTVGVDSSADRVEQIPLGASVTLTLLDPNEDQEYHVHGYELGDGVELAKGNPGVFQFVADKAGSFEVESHATETVLLTLEVG